MIKMKMCPTDTTAHDIEDLFRFTFESPVNEDIAPVVVDALVFVPDDMEARNQLSKEIQDAISSYLESVDDLEGAENEDEFANRCEQLVTDVLEHSGHSFRILEPTQFWV